MAERTKISNFYDKIPHRPAQGCWEWQGNLDKDGYGLFRFRTIAWRAHRFSWKHVNGDIPQGIHVLHRCDNRSCVNPEHLFLGTHQDNMADKINKNRSKAPRGSNHFKAKLTEEAVKNIRNDTRTPKEIASDYGVSNTNVCAIKKRKIWRHVT